MTRQRTLVTLGAVAVAAFAGQTALSGAAGKTIGVDDNFFSPKRATVAKNTNVTFRWRGDSKHDVQSVGKLKFKKAPLKTSGTHKVRLTKAGSYRYICTIHEDDGMTGTVVVK